MRFIVAQNNEVVLNTAQIVCLKVDMSHASSVIELVAIDTTGQAHTLCVYSTEYEIDQVLERIYAWMGANNNTVMRLDEFYPDMPAHRLTETA